MDQNLQRIRRLLSRLAERAAKAGDMLRLAEVGGHAKEYEAVQAAYKALELRVNVLADKLQESKSSKKSEPTTEPVKEVAVPSEPISRKERGSRERGEWVRRMYGQGITMTGHRKRYQLPGGQNVGIAFANQVNGRWFLGLPDEPTDIAVLLCRSEDGQLYDFVLPTPTVREVWTGLSRNADNVKLSIAPSGDRFILKPPRKEAIDISAFVGRYESLR